MIKRDPLFITTLHFPFDCVTFCITVVLGRYTYSCVALYRVALTSLHLVVRVFATLAHLKIGTQYVFLFFRVKVRTLSHRHDFENCNCIVSLREILAE